jgi:L-alanine-DL-glutamate epimerase-like enolase superfamily enzyme
MEENMKITRIETIPVSLPVGKFRDGMDKVIGFDAPPRYRAGRSLTPKQWRDPAAGLVLSNVIVKIHTDDGITGMGEAACDASEPVEVVKAMIDRHMAPQLLGEDPMNWEYLIDLVSFDASRGATRFSTSGIDLALHDLVAKALGIPVFTLVGGQRRDRVLASIEVPRGTPEKMAEHSREYYDQGVRGFKAKIGSDPSRDAESIKAMREALGEGVSLRADANCAYTLPEAKKFCSLVERFNVGLELLEQPLDKHDLAGFRELRSATSLPIEVDESAYSLSMVHLILREDAADIINTKCAKAGGIRGVKQWAAVAEAAGKQIVIGTEWGAGLKVAAKLHLGAAVKNADPVIEFTEIMIHELLLKEPLKLEDGYLAVPSGPGLGLELDEDKIEAFRLNP